MARLEALLLVLVIFSALGVVASQHRARSLHAAYEREQTRTQQLEVEWRQLQLEQSTWAALSRIESSARGSLEMRAPREGGVLVIEDKRP
jgi:cell division protein FtsL